MMLRRLKLNFLTLGENLVPATGLMPFGQSCSLVHVFNNLPPPHSGVVSTEGNLPLLGAIGYHTHLSAAEVVSPQILKPHTLHA